ncbi:MAG TPA: ribosome maturation factor RimM [Pyrinomonadaceae bacterium]|nr:ribosome maturation factor RimM [Pyrinomonadaceae bacterium]
MSEQSEGSREGLVIVARAVRTRGLKGELVADLLTDFPERFAEVSRLFGVGPKGELEKLQLDSYWFQGGRVVLKFAGYDTIEAAQGLIGFEFGVPEAESVKLAPQEFFDWQLEGCSVETQAGLAIGTVSGVLRTGGVELLVVKDSSNRELLIPMTEAIVIDIDIPGEKITVDPPDGLFEL